MENNELENEYKTENQSVYSSNKTMIKGFLVCLLVLLMLIPTPFILNLIEERQESKASVITEISNKWSGQQTVYGPFIELTYIEKVNDGTGKIVTQEKTKYVSANELAINGTIDSQLKSRSIYDAVVYTSKMNFSSKFMSYAEMLDEAEIKVKILFLPKLYLGFRMQKDMITS